MISKVYKVMQIDGDYAQLQDVNEEGAEWWVLAIIYNTQDVATLSEWLPDWNLKREEYKKQIK